jgi:hypothetical protein
MASTKLKLLHILARALGITFKVDGIPYGADVKGEWETYPK